MSDTRLPGHITLGEDEIEFHATVLRVIPCDDGIKRLEAIPDNEVIRFSDDEARNQFALAYMSRAGLKAVGLRIEGEAEGGGERLRDEGNGFGEGL